MLTRLVKKNLLRTTSKFFSGNFKRFNSNLANPSVNYMEEMEKRWVSDPSSVDETWRVYFESLGTDEQSFQQTSNSSSSSIQDLNEPLNLKTSIQAFIQAHQQRGHNIAELCPLGLNDADLNDEIPKELLLENYPLLMEYLKNDKPVKIGVDLSTGFLSPSFPPVKLDTLIKRLKEVYCHHIGVEFSHLETKEQKNWISEKAETFEKFKFSTEKKKIVLDRLAYADTFERFLAMKFPTAKRFGLEGCESLIPGLKEFIDQSAVLGVESFVIGMPHRGRLNVLESILRKPTSDILREFKGAIDDAYGTGDVKYHLGMSMTRELVQVEKKVKLSLVPNPSHLEAVNPVVEGKTRAKQFYSNDEKREKSMSILIHGDASFAGQGINYETFGLSDLHHYTTGGTLHIVVNNQIGFTTNPRNSRSSSYCTDLAKFIGAPIFHVNADDPEAVVHVCQLAAEWRNKFKKDIVVDIIGYRRHGHNELDQPFFTQPKMYSRIAKQPTTLEIYGKQLIGENVITDDDFKKQNENCLQHFENEFELSKKDRSSSLEWFKKDSLWRNFKSEKHHSVVRSTGVEEEILKKVGIALSSYPDEFKIHPVIKRILKAKRKMVETGDDVDWSLGEALAFGTLLEKEKYHVRISGQDVERGTFSHRHCVLVEQSDAETNYIPLNNISKDQAKFHPCNSNLSEFGVLGFELGYSQENPYSLIIWEAQFGDFSNGAQIIIDQFVSAMEDKWLRQTGLVILLPHGYEGQGPEHSSARPERFLQLCDEDPDVYPEMKTEKRMQIQNSNMQVVNCSTPANFFHVLRRQCLRDFRKPLIVLTPKSLLRHKLCVSKFSDMSLGSKFTRCYSDSLETLVEPEKVKRVIFCTGKVYYDLFEHRRSINDVAIVRIEQLSPFPFDRVADECSKYKNADIVWVQEEPKNMGYWQHVYFRFLTSLKHIGDKRIPKYVGRPTSSSPATGYPMAHKLEVERLLSDAFETN